MTQVSDSATVVRKGRRQAPVQVAQVKAEGPRELFFCVRPSRDEGGIETQARSIYNRLFEALKAQGAGPQDLITEKLFFSKTDPRFQELVPIRQAAYRRAGCRPETGPAVTFLHQPPCPPGRQCELQARAVVATSTDPVSIRSVDGMPGPASGKIVDIRGLRHIHLSGLTGTGGPDAPPGFAAQAERMFERSEACLRQEGASFRDVVRTWIYIADLERDYAAFNLVRTATFKRQGVRRIPASTGIQGATLNTACGCMMDLYALLADRPVKIEPMHAPTLNEAPSYGWLQRPPT